MYIEVADLFQGIIGIAAIAAIIYLIIVLHKFSTLITSINGLIVSNKENIDKLCSDIPEITENLKNVSEVITETTADVIVAKDNLFSNIEIIKDIMNIILSVFSKNK